MTFTPSAGGGGPSSVTLNYPSGFFATFPTPSANVAGATLTPAQPGATSIVLALSSGSLSTNAVTVTLVGCKMGAARAANDSSVTVQTDTDPIVSSPAVSSGKIGGAVTAVAAQLPP